MWDNIKWRPQDIILIDLPINGFHLVGQELWALDYRLLLVLNMPNSLHGEYANAKFTAG